MSEVQVRQAPGDGPLAIGARAVLHDTRNAVTAALLYAQFIEQCLDTPGCPPKEIRDALRVIKSNLDHAALLLAADPQPSRSMANDLVALVRDAVVQVPPQRARDVAVRWAEGGALAGDWDAMAITRILTNLLDNAAKYSLPGTPILVEITRGDASVEVTVRDHGIGVAEADLAAIFAGHRTAFARDMADGQGRGLQSSRRLAEDLGGKLWATPETRGGLAIHLKLPAAPVRSSHRADPGAVDGHRQRPAMPCGGPAPDA